MHTCLCLYFFVVVNNGSEGRPGAHLGSILSCVAGCPDALLRFTDFPYRSVLLSPQSTNSWHAAWEHRPGPKRDPSATALCSEAGGSWRGVQSPVLSCQGTLYLCRGGRCLSMGNLSGSRPLEGSTDYKNLICWAFSKKREAVRRHAFLCLISGALSCLGMSKRDRLLN